MEYYNVCNHALRLLEQSFSIELPHRDNPSEISQRMFSCFDATRLVSVRQLNRIASLRQF